MYIKRVTLQDFGRLTGTIEFSPDKCNIICQQNEFGKTTILDAILYALYNFPTTGFSRDTLKPKDRYRPWNGNGRGGGGFVVELELRDVGGRNYQLRADFTRQQPFTLHDADTLQPIPLDGMTFGQRYLRMPLPSFTQCFFLRQDEQGSGRNQLVSVIEEAAVSNRREAPSNVSQALELLSAPKMNAPGLCEEKILPRNLIRRLQEQKTRLTGELDALRQGMDAHRHDVESAGKLDADIAALDRQISGWETDLMRARRQEKQVLLNRYNEGRDAQASREKLLAELEPYAGLDVNRRSEIMSLLSDWKMANQRLQETKNSIAAEIDPELSGARSGLADVPESAAALSAADVDALRNARTVVSDRHEQFARTTAELEAMEADLRTQGVPLDRLAALQETDSALTAADREILFEHTAAHTEAQAALVALSENALHAREQVAKAKGRRSWYANLGMGATGLVVGFMIVGIVLLLTGSNFYGWVALLLAAVIGAGAMLYITAMRARVSAQELEPAIQTEMTLAAESRKIQEQLDTIESEYEATLQRLQLTPERVAELREAHQWRQSSAAWSAAKTNADRLAAEVQNALEEVRPTLDALGISAANNDTATANAAASLDQISTAITKLEKYLAAKDRVGRLEEKLGKVSADRDRLEADLQTKQEALAGLVESDVTRAVEGLEEKAQAYLNGCEKALQLQTLRSEYGAVNTMTPQEAEALQASIAELDQAIGAASANEETSSATDTLAGVSADELERRLAQSRRDRDEARERRNRGFRDAEKAVSDWRTRGPELEEAIRKADAALANAQDFADACELAQTELANIASEVYTQWATALNERVNHIMPMLNDRYTQVALSQELEMSVYSREAGRRLETRDIQHLSKGARDQLLLAVRIAIAEYLSAHVGNLPLALDEPFAHWDDSRFTEGMRFLGRLAEKHQVILLSCHGWRYDQLRETTPEVYEHLHFARLTEAQ